MPRFTENMTIRDMEQALAMGGGEGNEPDAGSLRALRKISGALNPLSDVGLNVFALQSAKRLELYGPRVARLYDALGGNPMWAATVLVASYYNLITRSEVADTMNGRDIPNFEVLADKINKLVPGYAAVFEAFPRKPAKRVKRVKGPKFGGNEPS